MLEWIHIFLLVTHFSAVSLNELTEEHTNSSAVGVAGGSAASSSNEPRADRDEVLQILESAKIVEAAEYNISELEPSSRPDDAEIILSKMDVRNLFGTNDTDLVEKEIAESDDKSTVDFDLPVLWINATFMALDMGMNLSQIRECDAWTEYRLNETAIPLSILETSNYTSDSGDLISQVNLISSEFISESERLLELELSPDLLEEYSAIGIWYEEICGNHAREFWYKTVSEANELGAESVSVICDPFTEELYPRKERLMELHKKLADIIQKATKVGKNNATEFDSSTESETERNAENIQTTGNAEENEVTDDQEQVDSDEARPNKSVRRRSADDAQDFEEVNFESLFSILDDVTKDNETADESALIIETDDVTSPKMFIKTADAAKALKLDIPTKLFDRHEKIGLWLSGICADYVPTAIDEFNATAFEGVDIEGPIGINVTALEMAGVNLTELAEKLRNDTEVDELLSRTSESKNTLGGSFILPVLQKNQYDPFSAPIVFQGSAVVVRFGIYIESMSNFHTETMDYDMDIYLIMAWRDARLVNPYQKPILVKEEEILEKIWRPDPFFANAKEAEFHEVTFLNFLMRIFSDGLVLYETRIKLKAACNLVLCKYPHDKQTCDLQIKSFAYPSTTVHFEWFTQKHNAIDKNPNVKLPELYIDRYEPVQCDRSRKSGDFSCLRAVFQLKRDVGFHIAQTYIPTSFALMFSWVGVWLPEEFMEGRIGVAITVLLTLSTESAGAREHLPSVSYLKAIDLWFGFITGFVFFTLLQTLFVIGFDKRANQLRKWANKDGLSQKTQNILMEKAKRYHKTGRYLDNFCRVFYPLTFTVFLMFYYFVYTEGQQDDCIATR